MSKSKKSAPKDNGARNQTHGDYSTDTVKIASAKPIQIIENLPDEILNQPRFFQTKGKIPVVKEWQRPKMQRYYNGVKVGLGYFAGFDICGHGDAPDYLVLDFDHIFDDNGDFVNTAAQKWYNLVAQSETYCEKSVSGHGLHAIFKPSDGEFKKMASGKAASLNLGGNAKIEIFYKPNGRYFLLTGDVYNCAPKTPISADCSIINTLLDEINHRPPLQNKDLRTDERADTSKALEMLNFIPCTDLDYNDWLAVGMILKTNGNTVDDWINWSRADSARFDEQTCRYKWDTFTGNEKTIASLCDMAKRYGYHPAAQSSNEPPEGATDAQIIEWIKSKLEWEKSRGGKWRASCTQQNVDLIFTYDPVIKNLMGYNEFYGQEVFLKSPFWKKNCTGDEWKNSDDSHLYNYIRRTYGNLKGKDVIFDTQVEFSRKNSFHPVKQYLENLEWDGTPRAETYFSKFLNIDDTPYTREITRKWLLGAVSRIYHEGCDFQFALVLHGKQGIGKGYCLRMLGSQWYVSLTDSLDDTHALDTIERGWIIEIAELAAGRKAEINAQKVFISNNADTRRKAFARRAETTKRHCVFGISVNDEHFLRDLTGNRRYKILESHSAQNEIVEGLTPEYVNQVWAEVMVMYNELFKNGFDEQKLRLTKEVDAQAEEIANQHIQDDGLQGEIESFLEKPILPACIWERLSKEERRTFFADGRIKIDPSDIEARIKTQIKQATRRDETLQEFKDYQTANIDDNPNSGYILIESKSYKGEVTDITTYYYGSCERESTCAAEIFNECFGNDKRKNTNRINEVLATLTNWKREDKHVRNFAGIYGQQNIQYWRDKTDEKPRHDTTFAARVSSIIGDEKFPF